ncbi:MAG: hypothetical protein NTX25_02270 [Proteobacteria bacterium]|nr:hypothetical protein [Pseudomonadota bacterium]
MNNTILDRFRQILKRAGATKKTQRLARRLLEMKPVMVFEKYGIRIRKADIGSDLLDDYPPSKLKRLLLDAGLAYCPNTIQEAQWSLVPIGAYKECWDAARDDNQQRIDDTELGPLLTELQRTNAKLTEDLDWVKMRLESQESQLVSSELRHKASEQHITNIWAAIKHIEANNPPVTGDKIEQHLRLVGDDESASGQ